MGHWRHRRSLHSRRSELAAASVGTNRYGYAYDTIGNRLWSAANSETNSYAANSLNQYTSVSAGANPVYDADGNMTGDGTFAYAYDAENRLVSACPVAPSNGALAVENRYDHRSRRIRKLVKVYQDGEWLQSAAHTFVWDGNNIVLEGVEFANGTTRTFEYFWGADKSGSEQGAGGVGGLLAVSVDGVFYIPCYDHNGNIVLYVSEAGGIAAQYTYDPYGNIVDSYGNLADVFSFGFSTQYHDRETGMIGYQRRFYSPVLGRWLNRDPIEEEGGDNLYAFCRNAPSAKFDMLGQNIYLYTGNDSGRWLNDQLHQTVVVDEWSAKGKRARIVGKVGFTFAFEGNWDWYSPSFSWLGFSGFVLPGYWMEGEVEEVGNPPGSPVAEKKTTCAQDRAWLRQMRAKVGRKDVYSVGRHNCRNFSQSEFEAAPGERIK